MKVYSNLRIYFITQIAEIKFGSEFSKMEPQRLVNIPKDYFEQLETLKNSRLWSQWQKSRISNSLSQVILIEKKISTDISLHPDGPVIKLVLKKGSRRIKIEMSTEITQCESEDLISQYLRHP